MDSSATDRPLVRVTIFQQPYTLRSSGSPEEAQALAASVDALMQQIASHGANNDPARVAVLASLHLADQVRRLEAELRALRASVDEALERLDRLTRGDA